MPAARNNARTLPDPDAARDVATPDAVAKPPAEDHPVTLAAAGYPVPQGDPVDRVLRNTVLSGKVRGFHPRPAFTIPMTWSILNRLFFMLFSPLVEENRHIRCACLGGRSLP